MLPCFLCVNATHHKPPGGGEPIHLFSDKHVPISEIDFSKFIKQTDESLRMAVQKVHDHHNVLGDCDEFKEKETELGWNYCRRAIVLNMRIRMNVASITMFDWAHVFLCDGLLVDEVGLCMSAFRTSRDPNTTYEEMGQYSEGWVFPGKRKIAHLFTKEKATANYRKKGFTCTGSEILTLIPVLMRYFKHVVLPRGRLVNHVNSIVACLEVVVLLLACRACCVSPDQLTAAIYEHLRLFREVYGEDEMRPKHHFALHLPSMLKRFGFLLTTFVNERKHRLIKLYTRVRCNPKSFEMCSMEDVYSHEIWELQLPFFNSFITSKPRGRIMHGLRDCFPKVPDDAFTLHRNLKLNGGSASCGDVVSYEYNGVVEIGQLKLCVGINTGVEVNLYAFVSKWVCINESADRQLRNFRVDDDAVKVLVSALDTVFTHRMSASGNTCALYIPYDLRAR